MLMVCSLVIQIATFIERNTRREIYARRQMRGVRITYQVIVFYLKTELASRPRQTDESVYISMKCNVANTRALLGHPFS